MEAWLATQEEMAIPFPALLEVQQGIHMVRQANPTKARELQAWIDGILRGDYVYPPITEKVALTLATLNTFGPLKTLWRIDSEKKMPGQDLFVAAISIVHRIPIATLDTMDFLMIDRYFPLPGVYNPAFGSWLVDPPDETSHSERDIWRVAEPGASPDQVRVGRERQRYVPVRAR